MLEGYLYWFIFIPVTIGVFLFAMYTIVWIGMKIAHLFGWDWF